MRACPGRTDTRHLHRLLLKNSNGRTVRDLATNFACSRRHVAFQPADKAELVAQLDACGAESADFNCLDLIADYVELTMSVTGGVITKDMIYALPTVAAASKLDKLVGLSAAMAGDAAFARQARRKFL